MKLLFAQARAREHGGAEAYVKALLNVAIGMGHTVGHVDIDGHRAPDGRLYKIPRFAVGPKLWNWAQVCRALPDISKAYDAVILGYGEGPALPVPALTLRHAPVLFSDQPEDIARLGARASTLRRCYVRCCRAWARIPDVDQSDLTLTNSHWTANHMQSVNGVRGVLFPPLPNAERRKARRIPLRLLALGRVVPNKRIERAVAVLNELRAGGHAATLEICGRVEGADATRLARKLALNPHVTLTANASPHEKARALAEATFGLHMYEGEHFGIAVAEMIRAGVTPVVYDDGGVRELVTDPRLRFKTPGNAANIISHLIKAPDSRRIMVHNLQNSPAFKAAGSFPAEAAQILSHFLNPREASDAA